MSPACPRPPVFSSIRFRLRAALLAPVCACAFAAGGIVSTVGAGVENPPRLRRDQSFLGIHFDFHAGADCTEVGARTTPEMVARIIELTRPDYLQVDCKGHPGYSSYPTRAGNPAPGFVGDPLRVWREETARRGVALYVHYSGVWDERAAALHPEWAAVRADGSRDPKKMSVFGPYADRLLIPQLKELARDYGVDGAWVDGECWATVPDHGGRAARLFCEETGAAAAPKKPGDPLWFEWMQFQREAYRNYLRHYLAAVRAEFPDFQICSNWAYTHHMPEPVSAAVDFLSGDLSAKNALNSARFAARYLARQGVPWDLMAWSFAGYEKSGGFQATAQKSAVQLKREAAAVLALGGGFQAYFTQNRDGSVRLDELDAMAEVARFARARQPFSHHAQQIPQVALLFSTRDYHRTAGARLFPQNKGAAQGLLQCLLENQLSVDVVGEETLARDMSAWPLVVVPEAKHLPSAFRRDLLDYAAAGGSLLVIGRETAAQFAALAAAADTAGGTDRVLAHGAGKIGLVPENIGLAYEKTGDTATRARLAAAVRALFPAPLVEVAGSPFVDVSASRKNGRLQVHLVNTSGDHAREGVIAKIAPVGPLTVSIRCAEKPSRVTLQPAGASLDFSYENGIARVRVGPVELHDILVVE